MIAFSLIAFDSIFARWAEMAVAVACVIVTIRTLAIAHYLRYFKIFKLHTLSFCPCIDYYTNFSYTATSAACSYAFARCPYTSAMCLFPCLAKN